MYFWSRIFGFRGLQNKIDTLIQTIGYVIPAVAKQRAGIQKLGFTLDFRSTIAVEDRLSTLSRAIAEDGRGNDRNGTPWSV